jgi:fatty-acyl-CoA synthase
MIQSTMQDRPLSLGHLLKHGERVYAESEVVTLRGEGDVQRARFGEVSRRAARLAAALTRLGVCPGERVGTFCWNTQEHLEAYLAVPAMGAVLHTLNIRLSPEQLTFVINHAEDRIVLVDASLVPLLAAVAGQLTSVRHFIVIGEGAASPALGETLRYEELLAAENSDFEWPEFDERVAAAMCYTSGTTGRPRGVVYSHRSIFLHSLTLCSGTVFGLNERDRILPIVPMFHVNAWGLPYAGWMCGADFIFPGRFLQAEPLCRLMAAERPTIAGAVPTIWNDVARCLEGNDGGALASLRLVLCGGSAPPRSLIERFEGRYGVRIIQGWGMTETSPLATIALPHKDCPPEAEMDRRVRQGHCVAGVELRVVDETDQELPWDDQSVGEIEVRGPWVTGAYYGEDAPEKFHDGWLRTGDVGVIDARGSVRLTDRAKDVIKSGGEWVSSVELENAIMAHAEVVEAAVIGVPDERWAERPLGCIVLRQGATTSVQELQSFLHGRVPKWWIPDRWTFITAVPKTGVGKFDKKVLRARYAEGLLDICRS